VKLLLALVAIFATIEAQAAQKSTPGPECGDFLERLQLARPDVMFLGCERRGENEAQGGRLDATYHVAGKDVAHVEAWLIRIFHATPLRYVCCGWETPGVSFKARDGAYYEIAFGGETVINRRKDWSKVPYLTLSVTHDLQEP
jgi:hypothetical protein